MLRHTFIANFYIKNICQVKILALSAMKGFWPFYACLCTSVLSFNSYAASAKLPTWIFYINTKAYYKPGRK